MQIPSQNTPANFFNSVIIKGLAPLMVTIFMVAATTVSAQEKSDDEWKTDLSVYLWGSSVSGNTSTGDRMFISFGTLIKNLDFAAMGTLQTRKNKFSMLSDVIYMGVSDSQTKQGEFLGHPVDGKIKLGLNAWIINLVGGYNLVDNGKNQFDLIGGARYLNLKVPVTIRLGDMKQKLSPQDHVWDGVIGFKGRHSLDDWTYIQYYGDIGTGDSDYTYQALVAWGYKFKKWDGVMGYRYLRWQFEDGAPALDRMWLHGPYIAAKWHF